MIKIGKNLSKFSAYSYKPEIKDELKHIIEARIAEEGPNCDLNDIDVSQITDMSYLFDGSNFNGDISRWNVSQVEDMMGMFYESSFNGDISNWDTRNVQDMCGMFKFAHFNQDISRWNVSNVKKHGFYVFLC